METLNNLTHLKVVKNNNGTYDIIEGSFNNILGKLVVDRVGCSFEPYDTLLYSELEAISKIVLAVNIRINDSINK